MLEPWADIQPRPKEAILEKDNKTWPMAKSRAGARAKGVLLPAVLPLVVILAVHLGAHPECVAVLGDLLHAPRL